MKKPSNIETWEDWPEDVRTTLFAWNHASVKRLRFPYTSGFTCSVCEVECQPNRYGDAVLDERHYCDECLTDYVRHLQPELEGAPIGEEMERILGAHLRSANRVKP